MTKYRLVHIPTGFYSEIISVRDISEKELMKALRKVACQRVKCPVISCKDCPWSNNNISDLEYLFEEIE